MFSFTAVCSRLLLSWNSSMQRCMSLRQVASSSVQESGATPPLLWPRLVAPRVGWNLIPISLRLASCHTDNPLEAELHKGS